MPPVSAGVWIRSVQIKQNIGEYQGVVRAVFEMDKKKWQPVAVEGKVHPRYFFTGHEVKDPNVLAKYLNKQVAKLHGTRNPIQYKNL